ncbi:FEKKY domain-containing protein [Elizabethkingia bruuniana]|uniref:FEKKY domain-containing protein n=1 Tax=Elizabethkingia bruuniana TaxID=1756149 RepID=UPI00099A4687|nr:hypothetical protein [Elizabethkingia bruuniana]OPC56822.1 hypothetical protein BAY07_07470 [Elizabethkingia bruuniana]
MHKILILSCLLFLFSGNIFGQKNKTTSQPAEYHAPQYATESNYLDLIKNKSAAFIKFGFAGIDGRNFQNKYGIGVWNMGCLVTSDLSQKAQINNTVLKKYLDKKHGNSWEKDLGFKP